MDKVINNIPGISITVLLEQCKVSFQREKVKGLWKRAITWKLIKENEKSIRSSPGEGGGKQ